MSVDGDLLVPAKALAIRRKAEAVEEIFPANQRDVPEAGDAADVLLDGDFPFQLLQQLPARRVVLQMGAQLM
jgi:hypothetical protein